MEQTQLSPFLTFVYKFLICVVSNKRGRRRKTWWLHANFLSPLHLQTKCLFCCFWEDADEEYHSFPSFFSNIGLPVLFSIFSLRKINQILFGEFFLNTITVSCKSLSSVQVAFISIVTVDLLGRIRKFRKKGFSSGWSLLSSDQSSSNDGCCRHWHLSTYKKVNPNVVLNRWPTVLTPCHLSTPPPLPYILVS